MKKRLMAFVLVLFLLSALFAGCGAALSEVEKSFVGKYELSELKIEGYPGITKNNYDYFIIEFFADKTCVVKSKANGQEYQADAEWKINGESDVEIITRVGVLKAIERYTLSGDKFTGTNSSMLNGESVEMTMTFTRIK